MLFRSDNSDIVAVCIKEVDALITELNDLNEKINKLRVGIKCQACGAVNNVGIAYCAGCGTRISNKK